jgi:4-hydroxy-tetrahydrodipicolinate synthase
MTVASPGPSGLYIPLITPFGPDGAVAEDSLERLAHEVLAEGADGIVALGTTAESATLSAAERRLVLDVCARVCREHGAPLVAGVGSNDTHASAEALRALSAWPEITAALVVVPYFTRPSEDGVVAHFAHLAAHSPVPLIVYNVTYRTAQPVGHETLRRLAALPGAAGVKQAVGGIDADTVALLAEPPLDFAVLAGDDAFAAPLLALGAAGGILASGLVDTALFAGLVRAWAAHDAATGRALGRRATRLAAALFAEPNPSVIKAVLHEQGRIPSPALRLPLLPASPAATQAALAVLNSVSSLNAVSSVAPAVSG